MAFIETPRFPEDISYGSTGGPSWNTDILILKSGYESRNANWGQMRYKYNAAMGVRSASQLDDLIHWFNAMQGRQHGFRFKDWVDYSSAAYGNTVAFGDQIIGIGNGAQTQFQCVKLYVQGSQTRTRVISKLVTSTTKSGINGVEKLITTDWTVNINTGIITYNTPPGNGLNVTAGFQFDVPVRFDIDYLSVAIDHYQTGTLSVPLTELRI